MLQEILKAIGLGVVLSIDCFFVLTLFSYCNKNKQTLLAPVFIGIFHIVFPIAMFYIALAIKGQIGEQTWIPAVAFVFLGLQQIFGKDDDDAEACSTSKGLITVIILAITVSIDSIFMGMSLAFAQDVNILLYAPIFGLVAFTISGTAVLAGRKMRKMIDVDLSFVCGIVFFILAILFYYRVI